jgi:carbonic anhydrase
MRNILNFVFPVIIILSVFSSCGDDSSKTTDCDDVHWTYTEKEGPEHWADLCTDYSSCGGKTQSPIDIIDAAHDSTLTPIIFNYTTTKTHIVNNGHTVQFNCDAGSKLTINGTEYDLLQFHFHGLSEHKVAGKHFPLEVHFVNMASDNNYAVIGVFFEEGFENALFSSYLSHFPHKKDAYDADTEIDLSSLFPTNKSYYNYSGSLTTPPCSEIVNWYVLKNTVTASAEQITEFQEVLHKNYRPVQPVNEREIKIFEE